MVELAPGYIVDLATQVGFLSAFLGGFAATLFGVLLTNDKRSRAVFAAIVLAAGSGIAFVVAVTATTQIVSTAHPEAPAMMARQSVATARVLMTVGFGLGVCGLLACIGAAGWIRSRATGIATTLLAVLGAVGVTLASASVTL
jgi:hypothetical protein